MGRPKKPRTKEHYYRAAKKHGYRARSAYKLRQIAGKYRLLQGVDVVVELCSSPGGWTQVLRELDRSLKIVAVDLVPMQPVDGVTFIRGDITDPSVIGQVERATGGSADLVLSDCSPRVTGNWEVDVARQLELAEITVAMGRRLLGPRGKVLAKVFQGPGFTEFVGRVRKQFGFVKFVKPDASRRTSAETYLLAMEPRETPTP